MAVIGEDLNARVGVDKASRKLAGLKLMGVIDNGVRTLCGIKSGAIGGVPTGSDAGAYAGVTGRLGRPASAKLPRPHRLQP